MRAAWLSLISALILVCGAECRQQPSSRTLDTLPQVCSLSPSSVPQRVHRPQSTLSILHQQLLDPRIAVDQAFIKTISAACVKELGSEPENQRMRTTNTFSTDAHTTVPSDRLNAEIEVHYLYELAAAVPSKHNDAKVAAILTLLREQFDRTSDLPQDHRIAIVDSLAK